MPGIWLGTDAWGEGAPVPVQIANELRGKEFRSFRAFREAFWKAIASDPGLAKQFDDRNLEAMKKGGAPLVKRSEQVGGRIKFELHHIQYISLGGQVYGVDNIVVVIPGAHISIHRGGE